MSDTSGFKLTPVTLGVIATCIGIALSGWNGVSYFKNIESKNQQQDMRLDQADKDRDRFNANIDKLTEKTGELKEAVVKLTTTIEGQTISKKAEAQHPDSEVLPADYVIKAK